MPLKRTQHWATREFNAHLRAHAQTAFAWGQNDCCLYPANAIQAFTGVDIAADFRGKYTDKESAFALIKTVTGGSTVADAAAYCAQQYGLVEYPKPLFAQRGDLVVVAQDATDAEDKLIAAIVHLNGVDAITVGERGLVRLKLVEKNPGGGLIVNVRRAWRV